MSARCALHPDRTARASNCRRCGNFACDECFGHPQSQLCEDCAELEGEHGGDFALPEWQRNVRKWARRHPRLSSLILVALGLALFALNVASMFADGRYYVILFPIAGVLMGLGAAGVLTARITFDQFMRAPAYVWVITAVLTVLGGLGGLVLNFL